MLEGGWVCAGGRVGVLMEGEWACWPAINVRAGQPLVGLLRQGTPVKHVMSEVPLLPQNGWLCWTVSGVPFAC